MEQVGRETKNLKPNIYINNTRPAGQVFSSNLGPAPVAPNFKARIAKTVWLVLFLLILLIIAGGAYYYFRILPGDLYKKTENHGSENNTGKMPALPEFLFKGFLTAELPQFTSTKPVPTQDGSARYLFNTATGRTSSFAQKKYEDYFKANSWNYSLEKGLPDSQIVLSAAKKDGFVESARVEIKHLPDSQITFVNIDYSAAK